MDYNSLVLGMSSKQQDFTSIRILLQISIEQREVDYGSYISRIVKDAKLILQSPENISAIDREMFDYSIFLSNNGGDWIGKVNPDDLKKEDIRRLLEVFEKP